MSLPFKLIAETDIEKYRAKSFWEKEPETVAWIESFKSGESFYDIGANVGVYSLYAASLSPNMQIYAFEPMPANYSRLVQNVNLNGFKNVHCFNIALGEKTCLERLYIPNADFGKSGAQIGKPVDEHGEEFSPKAVFTVQSYSLSRFVHTFGPEYPTHIKIDVDGHEDDVIRGASPLLFIDQIVKSVLIECNESLNIPSMNALMREAGLSTDNELNKLPNHSRIRRAKEGITAQNIIFSRS